MGMTLKDLVGEAIIKVGRARISADAGISQETIRKVINGFIPMPKTTYMLAKACGLSDEDAMKLASSDRAKESA